MKLKGSCHCRCVQFEVESHTPYPFMRCYCSICRKTAGGGGFAINIMGKYATLKIKGKKHISVYRAIMGKDKQGRKKRSTGQRHFCKKCASYLWMWDPQWPELVHPFASAIDTELPLPPEHVNIILKSAANWCKPPKGKKEKNFPRYPQESIEGWHKRHGIYKK